MPPRRLRRPNNQRRPETPRTKIRPNLNPRMEKIKQPLKSQLPKKTLLRSRLNPHLRHQLRERRKMARRLRQRIKSQSREPNLLPKPRQRAPKVLNLLVKILRNLPVKKRRKPHQPRDKRRRVLLRSRPRVSKSLKKPEAPKVHWLQSLPTVLQPSKILKWFKSSQLQTQHQLPMRLRR